MRSCVGGGGGEYSPIDFPGARYLWVKSPRRFRRPPRALWRGAARCQACPLAGRETSETSETYETSETSEICETCEICEICETCETCETSETSEIVR